MGLNMYAMVTIEEFATPVDFDVQESRELHFWRKHPNLHGWMERLYYEKGGKDPDFNAVTLLLTAADIDRLEQDILTDGLPEHGGFFFGTSRGDETEGDLAFIVKARKALAEGWTLYYEPSW